MSRYVSSASERHRCSRRLRAGFTLIEVLAALLLIGIVLPAIGEGISLATRAASSAQHRNEAAGLAEQKLAQILADGTWLNGSTSGDFGPDWPGYTWQATLTPYIGDTSTKTLQQIDLKVLWTARSHAESITLSTIAYDRSQTQ